MPYKGDKDKGGSIMKEWYKKRRKSADKSENIENNLEDPNLEPATDEELNEEEEFNSFFAEVLKKFPKKTSAVILKTYDKSKEQAEKILAKTKDQYNSIFDEFLVDVDEETKKEHILRFMRLLLRQLLSDAHLFRFQMHFYWCPSN